MGITVTVRDQSSTGRATGAVELEDIPSAITLRDLIRTRVREEVARYNAEPVEVFEGLVMPEGAEPTKAGFVMGRPRRVDWERQADRALGALARNGFFVLVDDRQVTELDERLALRADSDIRFVRLVQLVGGCAWPAGPSSRRRCTPSGRGTAGPASPICGRGPTSGRSSRPRASSGASDILALARAGASHIYAQEASVARQSRGRSSR